MVVKCPKNYTQKLTKHLYKGRSTRNLRFHWDWNWIMMVVSTHTMYKIDQENNETI